MSVKNFFRLPLSDDERELVDAIEALKTSLLDNEKKTEDILKDASCYDGLQLENQINIRFELSRQLAECQQKLRELEFKTYYPEPATTLMDFVSNIPVGGNDLGPEALIVVLSENVQRLYAELARRLSLNNVVIVTIGALIVGDVHAKLGRVKTALLDGPEAEYAAVSGGESVTLVISDRIPGDRLYHVWSDGHRDECFKRIFQQESGPQQ